MTTAETDAGPLSATDSELMQTEANEYPSFPVEVVGTVRVQVLPPVRSNASRVVLTDSVARQILARDPRRATAIIVPDAPIKFAVRQGLLETAPSWDMALARAPLTLHNDDELWIAPVTPLVPPAVLTVTMITENWTN